MLAIAVKSVVYHSNISREHNMDIHGKMTRKFFAKWFSLINIFVCIPLFLAGMLVACSPCFWVGFDGMFRATSIEFGNGWEKAPYTSEVSKTWDTKRPTFMWLPFPHFHTRMDILQEYKSVQMQNFDGTTTGGQTYKDAIGYSYCITLLPFFKNREYGVLMKKITYKNILGKEETSVCYSIPGTISYSFAEFLFSWVCGLVLILLSFIVRKSQRNKENALIAEVKKS
ncbi:MAG: hypothetical protein LBU65_17535 [Planctomycetaceae bacterium]|nr:hypothetical protein [Planctomycetaceae bacterium]